MRLVIAAPGLSVYSPEGEEGHSIMANRTTFGRWKVTKSGLANGSYKISKRTLWDGLEDDGDEHNQWEHHIKGKVGFDFEDFLRALSAARAIHAAYRPAGIGGGK